jgi:hypothetical protein
MGSTSARTKLAPGGPRREFERSPDDGPELKPADPVEPHQADADRPAARRCGPPAAPRPSLIQPAPAGALVIVGGPGLWCRLLSASAVMESLRRWSQAHRNRARLLLRDSTATGLGRRRPRVFVCWGSGRGSRRSRRASWRQWPRTSARNSERKVSALARSVSAPRISLLSLAIRPTIGSRALTSASTIWRASVSSSPARPCAACADDGSTPAQQLLSQPLPSFNGLDCCRWR